MSEWEIIRVEIAGCAEESRKKIIDLLETYIEDGYKIISHTIECIRSEKYPNGDLLHTNIHTFILRNKSSEFKLKIS